MKKVFTRVALEVISEKELDSEIKSDRGVSVYVPLLRLLAQATDQAALGDNTWISIGRTQDGSALCLAVHTPAGKLACYASTLGGLALGSGELL